MQECEIRRLHRVTYENGMAMQQTLVAMRQQEQIPDQLLLLEHPPTITLGRGGDAVNLLAPPEVFAADGIRFFETTRGGDVTYHGPGQIVGYPILHLGEGRRDVRKYVEGLEEVLIRTLAEWGIAAGRLEGARGVWVGNEKIAAVGIRVARWVTCHGFALNVTTNLDHFRHITPCGIAGKGVTSIERLLGAAPAVREVQDALVGSFASVFGRVPREREHAHRLVKVVPHDGERVLLLLRTPERGAFWQPVTGRIEPGEAADVAAQRELVEETGLDGTVEPLPLCQSFLIDPSFVPGRADELPFADETAFHARIDPGRTIRVRAEEHERSGWFTFARAYETIRWTDDREALEQVERTLASRRSAREESRIAAAEAHRPR
ncbi:MAG TPA: lipoyl(octanoyl) transferase LipB [Thermoanaerobaculia bacterium]|nr:lipoyl(octanoyl) transferase LipB [Thermoanaerobaculia bacterium]